MILSCGLNLLDSNRKHNEQTWYHRVHVQSILQCQPRGLIFIYKYFMLCTTMSPSTPQIQNCIY
jgi:hypothetical protein